MSYELVNDAYQLTAETADGKACLRLRDLATNFDVADGACIYRASRPHEDGIMVSRKLNDVAIDLSGKVMKISGILTGLNIEHTLRLPGDRALMEEHVILHNPTDEMIALEDLAVGLRRRVGDDVASIFPELASDRLVSIPFRHRPTDLADFDVDFSFADLVQRPGREHRVAKNPFLYPEHGYYPSLQWASEGWGWTHGKHTLGIFKFNQDAMEFSVLSLEADDDGIALRFGGAGMVADDPSSLCRIQPNQTVSLGVTRYQTVEGDYKQASYMFRAFLDEEGCRFPKGFNPPVHWNELYDNPECNLRTPGQPTSPQVTRPVTYTRALIEEEAKKAVEYSCESLYLDPGWDTEFGTFLWGEQWLGPQKDFVQDMRDQYGLGVSLHCPLATWMSREGGGVPSWPKEALRMDADGNLIEGRMCLGSKQYLDEAARRLLDHCANGAVFLMFDGNWWNGGCWNPDHDHPLPYTKEDHVRANLKLAQRVHADYPDVLIEMHDMVAGGSIQRYSPVYYKYGLAGSFDENWGFELMWYPMEDIRSGRAKSLYYYNLGCNVPVYLHIDLREDNEHCLVLWWYASTCRHLGIGGTHENPAVANAQKLAMKRYRTLERFYKEGEFYGLNEEAHVHALIDESAFVMNLFNLTDNPRIIGGTVLLEELGLDPNQWYINPKGGHFDSASGTFSVNRHMAPWSAETIEVRAIFDQTDENRQGH